MNALCLELMVQPCATIEDACREATQLADRLGIMVGFRFKDTPAYIRPGDDCQAILLAWEHCHAQGPGHTAAIPRR